MITVALRRMDMSSHNKERVMDSILLRYLYWILCRTKDMKDIDADLWRQHIRTLTVAALYYSYVDELILRIV